MTVPKSKRKPTTMQFLHTARVLESYCVERWDNSIGICKSYKRRREIKELAMSLFGTEDFNVRKINRKLKNKVGGNYEQ